MSNDNHQIEDASDAFDSVYADYASASISALSTILLPISEKIKMNEARHEIFTADPMNYFLQTGETSVPAPMGIAPAITTTSNILTMTNFLIDTIRNYNTAVRNSDIVTLILLSVGYGSGLISLAISGCKRGIDPTRHTINQLSTFGMPLVNLFHGGYVIWTMIDDPEENVTARNVGNVMNLIPASFAYNEFRLLPWYPVVVVMRTLGSATATVGMFIEAAEREASQELDDASPGEDEASQQAD